MNRYASYSKLSYPGILRVEDNHNKLQLYLEKILAFLLRMHIKFITSKSFKIYEWIFIEHCNRLRVLKGDYVDDKEFLKGISINF